MATEILEIEEDLAYSAALLHDVGYIEEAAKTGFHPIDGYNFLVDSGYQDIADLIVGHSQSLEQAEHSLEVHRAQGSVATLRRLKYLRDKVNGQ